MRNYLWISKWNISYMKCSLSLLSSYGIGSADIWKIAWICTIRWLGLYIKIMVTIISCRIQFVISCFFNVHCIWSCQVICANKIFSICVGEYIMHDSKAMKMSKERNVAIYEYLVDILIDSRLINVRFHLYLTAYLHSLHSIYTTIYFVEIIDRRIYHSYK